MKIVRERLETRCPPVDIAEAISSEGYSFYLDSCNNAYGLGRYSFLGCSPFLIFKSRGRRITVSGGRGFKETFIGDPIRHLQSIIESHQIETPDDIPFPCGGVGFFSYDLGRRIEKLPEPAQNDLSIPEIYFCFYDQVLIYDHLEDAYDLVKMSPPPEVADQGGISRFLREPFSMKKRNKPSADRKCHCGRAQFESNFSRTQYLSAVRKALDYIKAGDIYQVNLSQRFSVQLQIDHFRLYKKLRGINPAPFSAFLKFPEFSVLSTSPERFIYKSGKYVQTRPIKGTRPRSPLNLVDDQLARELLESEKDRAENLMIVDLERNDFGRICEFGRVGVAKLFGLESFATVHHLVSEVHGRLRDEIRLDDIIRACFPGGSITGAPKIRAMEIITELEPIARGIYTGSLGYIGFNQKMDLNIVIRTVLATEKRLFYHVGGGIVADSDPEAEYQETLDKGLAIKQALEQFICGN